jgi:hypothetical protein
VYPEADMILSAPTGLVTTRARIKQRLPSKLCCLWLRAWPDCS